MGSCIALLSRKQRRIALGGAVQCLQNCKENAKEILWMDGWMGMLHCCFICIAPGSKARILQALHCIGISINQFILNPVWKKERCLPEKDACMVGWMIIKGENLNCR